MIEFTIPGELPDLNMIIAAAKDHFGKYSNIKGISTDIVKWHSTGMPKGLKRVQIICHWYCKDRRKDPDNVAAGVKFILDGLVHAGVLDNDGWKQIAGIEHRFSINKESPRVVVGLMVEEEAWRDTKDGGAGQ